MNDIIKQLIQFGYKFHKDGLGYYFDKHKERLTIQKIGTYYNVYRNKLSNGQFILVNKQMNLIDLNFVKRWVLQNLC